MLDGMFSFVLLDTSVTPSRIIAARDPIGITTLYMGFHSSAPETIYFASELKALHEECDNLIPFPPGHFYDSNTKSTTTYFKPTWWDSDKGTVPHNEVDYTLLRESLEAAVKKRLMSEVPYGVLLSGGLDSSLIASIAARETDKLAQIQEDLRMQKRQAIAEGKPVGEIPLCFDNQLVADIIPDEETTLASWPQLHSFAVGLPGAPDLIAAKKAADFLGTVHHEYTFTLEEGLDAIEEVIYHLETFDVTTVRASTPMYLLSRKIKAMGVKMVLSGEGSDEIFGGGFTPLLRDIRLYLTIRIPLLPRRTERQGLPRGVCQASQELAHCRLSSGQQVDHGLGSRSTSPIPRQEVFGSRHERRCQVQGIQQGFQSGSRC
jgi:asparagine synthase (glutamine-hydrolysing)